MSTVYMVGARAANARQALANKVELLLDAAGLEDLVNAGKQQEVVIKVQVARFGNRSYLRPPLVRMVVDKIHTLGAKPIVVDGNGLGLGRNAGLEWFDSAALQGYTTAIMGEELTLADSYTGGEGEVVAAKDPDLGFVKVARLVKEARSLLVISHVTAHPLTGMAGAITSLGLGCLASQDGKSRVHAGLTPRVDAGKCDGCGVCVAYCEAGAWKVADEDLRLDAGRCNGCAVCLAVCPQHALSLDGEDLRRFQRRVADSALAVAGPLAGRVRFFNFLLDVVPQPDDYPYSDNPFVPDLGVMLSDDPVAIDQASLDAIQRARGVPDSIAADHEVLASGQEKLGPVSGTDPYGLIRHAESLGLGTSRYQLLVAS